MSDGNLLSGKKIDLPEEKSLFSVLLLPVYWGVE